MARAGAAQTSLIAAGTLGLAGWLVCKGLSVHNSLGRGAEAGRGRSYGYVEHLSPGELPAYGPQLPPVVGPPRPPEPTGRNDAEGFIGPARPPA